jgi:hypothetical protein
VSCRALSVSPRSVLCVCCAVSCLVVRVSCVCRVGTNQRNLHLEGEQSSPRAIDDCVGDHARVDRLMC